MNCAPATAHHHYKSRHNYTTAASGVQGISPSYGRLYLHPLFHFHWFTRARAPTLTYARKRYAGSAQFFFSWHVRSICLTWAGWNSLSCRVKRRDRDPTPFFFPPVISTLHNIAFYRPRSYVHTSVCIRAIWDISPSVASWCTRAIAAVRASHFSTPSRTAQG